MTGIVLYKSGTELWIYSPILTSLQNNRWGPAPAEWCFFAGRCQFLPPRIHRVISWLHVNQYINTSITVNTNSCCTAVVVWFSVNCDHIFSIFSCSLLFGFFTWPRHTHAWHHQHSQSNESVYFSLISYLYYFSTQTFQPAHNVYGRQ